jgi:hypothetical protein
MSSSNEVHRYCILVREYCGSNGFPRASLTSRAAYARMLRPSLASSFRQARKCSSASQRVQLGPGGRTHLRRRFVIPEFRMLRILAKGHKRIRNNVLSTFVLTSLPLSPKKGQLGGACQLVGFDDSPMMRSVPRSRLEGQHPPHLAEYLGAMQLD